MARVIGIDLGTTNSLVAAMDGDQPRIIAGRGRRSASALGRYIFTPRGPWSARRRSAVLLEDPEHVVYSVKRLMGGAG